MEIRQARIADVPAIAELVDRFARQGEVLPRKVEEIYQTVREWMVAEHDGQLLGCGSLVILWSDMAEVRSLVVVPEAQGMGIGRRLVAGLLAQATELDLTQVIALTRQPGFFLKQGFRIVFRDSLPRKMWKDCVHCLRFDNCDEVAMLRPVSVPAEEPAPFAPNLAHDLMVGANGKCIGPKPHVLQEALHGIKNGDKEALENGIAEYV